MEDRRPLVIAFLVAVMIVGAGAAYYVFRGDRPDIARIGQTNLAENGEDARAARSARAPITDGDADADADADAAGDADGRAADRSLSVASNEAGADEAEETYGIGGGPDDDDAAPRAAPPSFDIVRVDPSGTAVVAGRGEPGGRAVLYANGVEIAEAEIDEGGEWVLYVEDPLQTGPVELSLAMRTDDDEELRSDQVVLVAVPETRDSEPLVVLGRPGGASRVIQSPLEDMGLELALLAVDYDDAGGVIFSGRARENARVRVFADRSLLGETRANGDGEWSLVAGATIPPGLYELQVDQLDDEGRVTAVIAVPFERATPEAVAAAGPETIVVQPGNSLWRLARSLYGSGWQYTVIYAANEEQIRDPDLIYPGQVFNLPEGAGDSSGDGRR